MTAQISERLIYEGQQLSMCTNPLSLYFARGGDGPNLSVAEFCVNGLFAGDCRRAFKFDHLCALNFDQV